jgi:hypothetical protein
VLRIGVFPANYTPLLHIEAARKSRKSAVFWGFRPIKLPQGSGPLRDANATIRR